jgi:hypothetical protein
MKRFFRLFALLWLATQLVTPGLAQDTTTAIQIAERSTLGAEEIAGLARPADKQLHLTLVYFTAGAWPRDAALDATRGAVKILKQCGVAVTTLELVRVTAPLKYQYLDTPSSRELARSLSLAKPTVYFVTDTRQEPQFEAEAVGRTNSASRPEMTDTVWVTRHVRDVDIALAHELVHVLSDSGAHIDVPRNLMREETSPTNTQLSNAQCAQLRAVGEKNGLLHQPR